MNLILGFGSTEKSQQEGVFNYLYEFIEKLHLDRFGRGSCDFFHEDDVQSIKDEVARLDKELLTEYEEIEKNNTKPERYFKISSYDIGMGRYGSNLFIGIEFWHINSRHPLSPDGMALLQEKKCYWINSYDF